MSIRIKCTLKHYIIKIDDGRNVYATNVIYEYKMILRRRKINAERGREKKWKRPIYACALHKQIYQVLSLSCFSR